MIISPPFLPIGAGNVVDIDLVMFGDGPGQGAFPVSYELAWHGGTHLSAPIDGAAAIPVRAIADGVIKYVGTPDTSIGDGNPLYYYNGETSNGVVVIEHKTEIGEDVEVVFYSIYMHLSKTNGGIIPGKKIYRKDEIGAPGLIYGAPNKIHMEIICDDTNLKKLIGRSSGKLTIESDGRADALWGEMYFSIPTGIPVFDSCTESRKDNAASADHQAKLADETAAKARKAAHAAPKSEELKRASTQANADAAAAHQTAKEAHAHIAQAPVQIGTVDTPIFVGMRYDKGTCTFSTYSEDGKIIGTRSDQGYEYKLYDKACALYPQCPSAGFDLLRFGRIIGPDALQPADAAHWRQVVYANGKEGWINLRPDAIKKFSDADFPHWRGWLLVDDDTDGDSRCDSALIKSTILPDANAQTKNSEYWLKLSDADTQNKLQRAICRIPSIWSNSNIDQRWGWLKSNKESDVSPTLQNGLNDESFQKLKAHLEVQMFWEKTGLPDNPYWHFNPKEFIRAFRHCGWLSLSEMTQMFPATALRKDGKKGWVSEAVTPKLSTISDNRVDLNKSTRKFNILTPDRMSCFYGNATQETAWFRTLSEIEPKSQRYYPWYGRGFFQLTWSDNAIKYWEFLGRDIPDKLKKELTAAQKQADLYAHTKSMIL